MANFFDNKKHLLSVIYVLIALILTVGAFFGIKAYLDYKAVEQVKVINAVLDNGTENFDNCGLILDFDQSKATNNDFFNKDRFNGMFNRCNSEFNIKFVELDENICRDFIRYNKSEFKEDYVVLVDFDNKRNECISKYLVVNFSTGALFDIENDFKSEINIDFSLSFYSDIGDENSDEFINNRIEAKKRLKDLIIIEPSIDFSVDDIVLYPRKGILKLPLKPLTEYKISLKNFETTIGEKTKNEDFILTTPENKYFGMKILDKVSLYQDNRPPRFEILEYNTTKTKTKLKICRIPNETYAKIEVFRKKAEISEVNDFFLKTIDRLESFDCEEKEVDFSDLKTDNKGEISLVKKEFNFDDLIGEVSRSGLYFVTFSNSNDRIYNERLNYPIFFGIVDSHITMKISRNGEAFFFVNDFEGNPLANQNIKLYLNDFKEFEKKWNRNIRDDEITYFDVVNKNVFGEAIYLGLTGDDGILRINLKEDIDDFFGRTFSRDWEYSWEGLYKTFFITSASDTNISYVNSTWNSGIAPWNFGYKIGSGYYGNEDSNQDAVMLNVWGRVEPEYYSHTYTDRLLYLPGETVNIKAIVRKSKDLSIDDTKEVTLKVTDSKGKSLFEENLKISEFGSVSKSFKLSENSPLGNYNISISVDGIYLANSGFSVEVFKNPKFKNEISLSTEGLNEGLVEINKQEVKKHNRRNETLYSGHFKIKGTVFSKYYNGSSVVDANFKYKVYKQYYYDNSYWDECYYGCYWEPRKEFYSEGKGILDSNGVGSFDIDVDFSSNYADYKYIVEVTVTDKIGDIISGSNSVIARLPNDYKRYNNDLSVVFKSDEKFIKAGDEVVIDGGLNIGKWTGDYNDKYLLVVKKKEYKTIEVDDVRGYKRSITRVGEKLEKILFINDKNFTVNGEGDLILNYALNEVGEYIFEYGKIQSDNKIDIKEIISAFNSNKVLEKEFEIQKEIEICEKTILDDSAECVDDKNCIIPNFDIDLIKKCEIISKLVNENIKLSDLFTDKKYFSILTYGDTDASNPIQNDNKIKVIPGKISYHLGEKAKVLIRLPFSKGKILWTIEKQGVIEQEYIDVTSNVFFKEIDINDTFVPNAYIGVVAIEVDGNKIPEYKVGYSEIVVDKTDKKSFINVKPNKEKYSPREEVTLDIKVLDKNDNVNQSELTVMVVDDSLISLLGNVDLNTLEKFYKKLPFQIQTSITNIAMLRNYYFSRPGIVGGSGFGNFKGGDSAVSSRNIFKNTAYYNPSVITDVNGLAKVSFELPDNLTNFRVMVLSNSKDNLFGYSESFIEVRKNVIVEDKTPLILRDGDVSVIGANIFNNTDREIGFKVELETSVDVAENIKNITIAAGKSQDIYWTIKANSKNIEIPYKITALGDSAEDSDKVENIIKFKESPLLVTNIIKSGTIDRNKQLTLHIDLPENIDLDKSEIEISFSNNKLDGIEKIVNSLAAYPYGCIEQTVSSTLPNVILKGFNNLLSGVISDKSSVDENIEVGIERIISMQTDDGGFSYWQGSNESNLHITPYVVRSMVDMIDILKENTLIPYGFLAKSIKYLENNLNKEGISDLEKAEIFWALTKAGKIPEVKFNTETIDRHTLIAYTYGLILSDKEGNSEEINLNIELIKYKLKDSDYYSRYWNTLSDKAIFASLLIDYDYSRDYIDKIIDELYDYDWSSYYYSTQSKNNAFISFYKYIKKYSAENNTKFGYSVGSYVQKSLLEVGGTFENFYKKNFALSDVLREKDEIELTTSNITGSKLYINYTLKVFPKDKVKIKSYENGISVKREIYEVIDENDIKEKCSRSNNNYSCIQAKGLKLVEDNIYKKGTLYKTKIIVNFEDSKDRRNMTIEDYLPSTFKVINSRFKTEQIAIKQGTKGVRNWNHIEYKPDVVMANAKFIWSGGSSFEYFFRPEFKGVYVHPPVTAYMMYNPQIRANSEFRVIEVK